MIQSIKVNGKKVEWWVHRSSKTKILNNWLDIQILFQYWKEYLLEKNPNHFKYSELRKCIREYMT